MMQEDERKWYSGGLTYEVAKGLNRFYARVEHPEMVLSAGDDQLELFMTLQLEDGASHDMRMRDMADVRDLLRHTQSRNFRDLDGKTVEVYREENRAVKGLSVNPHFK